MPFQRCLTTEPEWVTERVHHVGVPRPLPVACPRCCLPGLHSGLCSDSVASAPLDLDKMPQPRRLLRGGEGLVTRAGGPGELAPRGGGVVLTERQREEPGQ